MTSMRLLAFRVAILALLAVSLVATAASVALVPWPNLTGANRTLVPIFVGLEVAVVLTAALLAGALLWRNVTVPGARALAVFLAGAAMVGAVNGIDLLARRYSIRGAAYHALDAILPIGVIVCLIALLHFSVLFPRRLTRAELGGRYGMLSPNLFGGAIVVAFLALQTFRVVEETGQWALGGGWRAMDIGKPIMIGFVLFGVVSIAANFRAAHAIADRDGRRRIYWVLEGVVAAAAMAVLASAIKVFQMVIGASAGAQAWYPIAMFATLLVVLLFLGVATFYAGAVDPTLALQRTAVAGVLGTALVFVFAATEQLVQGYLTGWLGLSDRIGGILTGGVVALSVEPLKRRLDAVGALLRRRLHTQRPAAPTPPDPGAFLPS